MNAAFTTYFYAIIAILIILGVGIALLFGACLACRKHSQSTSDLIKDEHEKESV